MTPRASFDQDAKRDAGAVHELFDAMIRALTGGERRQWREMGGTPTAQVDAGAL